jgi:hypothetical protein
MTIAFACGCGRQLRAPDACAGRQAKCPACGAVLTVPAPPAASHAPKPRQSAAALGTSAVLNVVAAADEVAETPVSGTGGFTLAGAGGPAEAIDEADTRGRERPAPPAWGSPLTLALLILGTAVLALPCLLGAFLLLGLPVGFALALYCLAVLLAGAALAAGVWGLCVTGPGREARRGRLLAQLCIMLNGASVLLLVLGLVSAGVLALFGGKRPAAPEVAAPAPADRPGKPEKPPEEKLPPALCEAIRQGIRDNQTKTTEMQGAIFSKQPFQDVPAEGALLIGFEVGESTFAVNPIISYLRPIYLTTRGEQFGASIGPRPANVRTVKAKPGYAVGGLKAHGGSLLDGFSLTYMRLIAEHGLLKAGDSYESGWQGGTGGSGGEVGGDGSLVVGVAGRTGDEGKPGCLGLVMLRVRTRDP